MRVLRKTASVRHHDVGSSTTPRAGRGLVMLVAIALCGVMPVPPAAAEAFDPPAVGATQRHGPPTVSASSSGGGVGSTTPITGLSTGTATVSGSGFGHGVGMSQYGAYAMAKQGFTAEQILKHYYTGARLSAVTDAVDIAVNVVHQARSLSLEPVPVGTSADGVVMQVHTREGAQVRLAPKDVLSISSTTGGALALSVTRAAGSTGSGSNSLSSKGFSVTWTGTKRLAGRAATVRAKSQTASSAKTRLYRWGRLSVTPVNGKIEGVLTLGLHGEYLRGIDEMPSSWPSAALQAQAIAARTYALRALTGVLPECGGCQLWDDTRSQNYVGWAKERERVGGVDYGARWVAAVAASHVAADTSRIITYQGQPIEAFYSSSTGGRTRTAKAVWGGDIPYLVSVSDPWSLDPRINPSFAAWKRSASIVSVRSLFGLPNLVSVRVTARDATGAATTITGVSANRAIPPVSITATRLQRALGLPSLWIGAIQLAA